MQDYFPSYGSNNATVKPISQRKPLSKNRENPQPYSNYRPHQPYQQISRFGGAQQPSLFSPSTQNALNKSGQVQSDKRDYKANSVNDKTVLRSRVYAKPFGSDRKPGFGKFQPFKPVTPYTEGQKRVFVSREPNKAHSQLKPATQNNTQRIYGRTYVVNSPNNIMTSNIYSEGRKPPTQAPYNAYGTRYSNNNNIAGPPKQYPNGLNSVASDQNILISNSSQNSKNTRNFIFNPKTSPMQFFPSSVQTDKEGKRRVHNTYTPPMMGNTTHFIQTNHFITINNPVLPNGAQNTANQRNQQVYPLYPFSNKTSNFNKQQTPKMVKSYSNQSITKSKHVFKPHEPLSLYRVQVKDRKLQNVYAPNATPVSKKEDYVKNIYTPVPGSKRYPKYVKQPNQPLYSEQSLIKEPVKWNRNKPKTQPQPHPQFKPKKVIEKIPYPKSARTKKTNSKKNILQKNMNDQTFKTKMKNSGKTNSKKESLLLFLKRNNSKDLDLEKIDLGNKKKSPRMINKRKNSFSRNMDSSPMRRKRGVSPLDAISQNLRFFEKNKRRSATINPPSKIYLI